MLGIAAQVRIGEEGGRCGEPRLEVTLPLLAHSPLPQEPTQAQQPLRRDRSGGAVHRFMIVERIRGPVQVARHGGQSRGAGVPIRDAIARGVGQIEVRHRAGGLREALQHALLAFERAGFQALELLGGNGAQVFEQLRKPRQGPGQAAGPGREWRVALLGARAAIGAADHVEDRLVGRPAPDVVGIPAFAVVDVVPRRSLRVAQESLEQRDPPILLAHEEVSETVGGGQHPQGAHRVHEQRVGTVERTDVAQIPGQLGPPGGLHRP